MLSKNSFAVSIGLVVVLGLSSCATTENNSESVSQTEAQAQQEIKITGSGSVYPAIKALAAAYEAQSTTTKITFLPPGQSGGGVSGVKDDLIEIGGVSRKLKPEEDDGTVVYREIARDALLVATHPSVEGVTNLTTEQLKSIYSGEATNWQDFGGPDAAIVVLDRPEDESAKRLLREYYLGKELPSSPDAVILRQESDLVSTVQTTPYSIGAFSLARAIANDLPVNRLSLDGVEPTLDNLQANKYQMARKVGIVWKQNPAEHIKGFVDFSSSEAGERALRDAGYVASQQ